MCSVVNKKKLSESGWGYSISWPRGEASSSEFYSGEGNLIESCICEDVPVFKTNSGKEVYCIADSGENCQKVSKCQKMEC